MLRTPSVLLSAALLLATVVAAPVSAAPSVERVSGADRFATAAALARDAYGDPAVVVVATGGDYPDALAAGPYAARADGPLLLTATDRLPAPTEEALRDLTPERVVVAGGTAAVSEAVVARIEQVTGVPVERVAGTTRYATAAALAGDLDSTTTVFLTTGEGYADALPAGAAAAADGAPLLLSLPDRVPEATWQTLDRLAPDRIVIVGGTGAVSFRVAASLRERTGATVDRLAGPDRFATAAATAFDASTVYLATGVAFPDGLALTPAAAQVPAPVLLSLPDCLPAATADRLDRIAPDRVVLVGGRTALSEDVAALRRCGSGAPVVTTLYDDLDVPWDVDWTSTGVAFVTERDSGRVLRLEDGTATEVHRFEVDAAGEGGLLGIAVHPDDDGLLYAYMTAAGGNRLVRFRPGGTVEVLIDGIPKNSYHDAGRIAFGPDGMLYVTTGDAGNRSLSQDRASLAGKILRVTPDGQPAPGNPFDGSRVWALGFRDPQGLAWDADGTLYATEFGPDRDDEVNRIEAGGNYGWPHVTGDDGGDPRFVDPVVVRQPPDASWSGATFLVDSAIPSWDGDLFVAALRGTRLWRFGIDGGTATEAEVLYEDYGRLRAAAQAPDGSLWLLTSNRDGRGDPAPNDDRILRVAPR